MKSIPVPLSDYATPLFIPPTDSGNRKSGTNAYYIAGGILLFILVNGVWFFAYNKQSNVMRNIESDHNKVLAELNNIKTKEASDKAKLLAEIGKSNTTQLTEADKIIARVFNSKRNAVSQEAAKFNSVESNSKV